MNIVYIDVQNSHKATQKLWRLIDWDKFYIYLKDKCKADIVYYAVWHRHEFQNQYDKLTNIWYAMLYKETTLLPNGELKWNVDIDIAIRAIFDICKEWLSKAYLVTNDGDYNTLIEVFQDYWVWWKLITPDINTASKLLKRITRPIDIDDIKNRIQKIPLESEIIVNIAL